MSGRNRNRARPAVAPRRVGRPARPGYRSPRGCTTDLCGTGDSHTWDRPAAWRTGPRRGQAILSCARAPVRNPPPGFFAEAKFRAATRCPCRPVHGRPPASSHSRLRSGSHDRERPGFLLSPPAGTSMYHLSPGEVLTQGHNPASGARVMASPEYGEGFFGDARKISALHLDHTPDDLRGSFWQRDTGEIASVRLSDRRMESREVLHPRRTAWGRRSGCLP